MNKFFINLKSNLGSRKLGKKSTRSRFNGASGGSAVLQRGIDSVYTDAGQQNVINQGRRSYHNEEAALHNNAISLSIKNNDSANKADLVLSAGRFGSLHSGQLLADGTNNTTNDAAQTVSVTATAEYGVDGTTASWATVRDYIEKDGMAIKSTRIEWETAIQKIHKLRFKRKDFFGDDVLDHIAPQVYWNPDQYHEKAVQSNVAYVLDDKTIVKFTVEPGETVLFTFWVAGLYEKERILTDFARRLGGNSMM